jgi:hypothetical protein
MTHSGRSRERTQAVRSSAGFGIEIDPFGEVTFVEFAFVTVQRPFSPSGVGRRLCVASPATATPLAISGFNNQNIAAMPVEQVGWRRPYRGYGYPVPYAYYPPANGYYAPPPAYAYYPPPYGYAPPPYAADGDYPSAEADDGGDYPPPTGDYGDYPPANGY